MEARAGACLATILSATSSRVHNVHRMRLALMLAPALLGWGLLGLNVPTFRLPRIAGMPGVAAGSLESAGLAPAMIAPADLRFFYNASAVERAVSFIVTQAQPGGSFITSHGGPTDDDVVPMSLAHSVWALSKASYAPQARAALDWVLKLQDTASGPYYGSWYNHYHTSGVPYAGSERGRGEDAAMVISAVFVYSRDHDESYLRSGLGGSTVYVRVRDAASFLTRLQLADGRFRHSVTDDTAYSEENARMVMGMRLASLMAGEVGDDVAARAFLDSAGRGYSMLAREDQTGFSGFTRGMAYDYYWGGIWDLAGTPVVVQQLDVTRWAGLLSPAGGVRNRPYDTVVLASETFDWAIANNFAANRPTAEQVVRTWAGWQRQDGGFPDWHNLLNDRSGGTPTSYAAARFIILNRLLAETN